MAVSEVTLEAYEDADFDADVSVVDTNAAPVELAGYAAFGGVTCGAKQTFFACSVQVHGTGKITLHMDAATVADLRAGQDADMVSGKYDVFRVPPGAGPLPVQRGPFRILKRRSPLP